MTHGGVREGFHQASWREPLIMNMGESGRRGLLVTSDIPTDRAGADHVAIPDPLARSMPPTLPEVSQQEVVRHFTRLSQMVLGNSVANNIGLGTTTMKYSPLIDEALSRFPTVAELHPAQPEETFPGLLQLIAELGEALQSLSGMSQFSFQAGGGAAAIYGNVSIIAAYHAARGDTERDEIITTIFSHPANAATASTRGFKVKTLYPGPDGYATLESLEAALTPRTAGLLITNPEDTGLFNPSIEKFVAAVHEVGGLCVYDQANANSLLGVARAADAGFDLCHFNLHKTFAVPHGSMGGAVGALGVREGLQQFLPSPIVVRSGDGVPELWDPPRSIGRLRSWHGNVHSLVKAYAWIRSVGVEYMKQAAEIAVLNNNYLDARIRSINGTGVYAPENDSRRLGETRYSWEDLTDETGIGTQDVHDRMIDFGLQGYFTSHHPWLLPEPFTLEPTESASLEDLDEFAAVMERIADEARCTPQVFDGAPHRSSTSSRLIRGDGLPVTTWAAYQRKRED